MAFNEYMVRIGNSQCKVEKYEEIFKIEPNRILSILKVCVIQAMIQIERPRNWNLECVKKLAIEIKMVEIYNSAAKHRLEKARACWGCVV